LLAVHLALVLLLAAVQVELGETVHVKHHRLTNRRVPLLAEILAVMGATPDSGTW